MERGASRVTTAVDKAFDSWGLPVPYRILPYSIPFDVPGFHMQARPTDRVLAPTNCVCDDWFHSFTDNVAEAVGRRFLPVCRMSDGEFFFLFGHQSPSLQLTPLPRLVRGIRQTLGRMRLMFSGFQASTAPGVSSGTFTAREWHAYRPMLADDCSTLLRKGTLGIHLSYGKTPFQEAYFPALAAWLREGGHRLSLKNYVPFYFVYALVRGPAMRKLIADRRVLVVHCAIGPKREAITRSLLAIGAQSVKWLAISPSRSFADRLDLTSLAEAPEVCLVGAGIGKLRILVQLEPLQVPCIDAGYAFEVWADPERQWDRPYMTPDETFDAGRVRWLSAADRAMLGRS